MADPIRAALERLVVLARAELDAGRIPGQPAWERAMADALYALAAAPEGEGPSESDVANLFYRHMGEGSEVGFENAIAEALARWGRFAAHAALAAAPPALPPNYIDPEYQGEDLELLQTFYAACRADGGTADEIHLRGLRAVLAARPTSPATPLEGEVAELVAWLRRQAGKWQAIDREAGLTRSLVAEHFTRAADLLEQHQVAPVPVAVSERLPEPNVKVLAHYFNGLGKGRTICAIWVPAKTRSDSYGNDDFTEYDEDSDTFYWPEGWYEAIENWDDLGYVKVDEGEVIYWQPLPKWPAHALPLPAVEVQP